MADIPNNNDTSYSGKPLLKEFGRECLIQLLPRTDSQKVLYSSYANRFMIDPRRSNSVKSQLLDGEFGEETLHDLLLDDEMLRAARREDHAAFVELRLAKIASVEELFYTPHLEAMGLDARSSA